MIIFTDGGFRPKTGAYGSFRMEDEDGNLLELRRIDHFEYEVLTNNAAEYATLYEALHFLIKCQIKERIVIYSDSLLMIQQIKKNFKINHPILLGWADEIWELLKYFKEYTFIHVPRSIIVGKLGH